MIESAVAFHIITRPQSARRKHHASCENQHHRRRKRRRHLRPLGRQQGTGRHRPRGHPAGRRDAAGQGARPVRSRRRSKASTAKIIGTTNYEPTDGSDVVIVTAGIARKPGMSRDDLININTEIVKSVAENVAKHSPNAVMIVVSNPLDAMVYVAWKASGFRHEEDRRPGRRARHRALPQLPGDGDRMQRRRRAGAAARRARRRHGAADALHVRRRHSRSRSS